MGEHDVGSALRSLQERARASDAKSEEVHEKWLDGEIKDVDTFVEEFRRLREKHHEDAVKASMLAYLGCTNTAPLRTFAAIPPHGRGANRYGAHIPRSRN